MNKKEKINMLDLAVVNGLVFVEGGFRKADVGIQDGKFALVARPAACPRQSVPSTRLASMSCPAALIPMCIIVTPATPSARPSRSVPGLRRGGCTTFFEHPISIPPQYNADDLA